jgi:ATP-dependent protease ClpP protease subunit
MDFIRIKNQTPEVTEIDIDGIIGWDQDSWPEIKKQLNAIATAGQKKLIVNIYSPGGFVSDGLMIHDALKISKAKIETRVFSMTASAATLVAQSGDVRKMSANALYLIHKSSALAWGNANEMEAMARDLKTVDERITDIYVKKGADKKKVEELLNENNGTGKWIDAEEALAVGLIDEIMEPSRAAAIVPDKEFLSKYKLPEIPSNLMSKINLTGNPEGEATRDPKSHTFLKGIIQTMNEFLGGSKEEKPAGDAPGQSEQEIADKAEADRIAAEAETARIEAERVETERIAAETEAARVYAETAETQRIANEAAEAERRAQDPVIVALNTRVQELENANRELQTRLDDAQTRLSQAGARSTILTGTAGREGDNEIADKVKEATKKDLQNITKVFNGGYLENPKPKK